jgi:hypothetical protein
MISGPFSITHHIIFINSGFVTLVYIVSMSNEHIPTSLLISMDCKSKVKYIEFLMLFVLGRFKQLCDFLLYTSLVHLRSHFSS